MSCPVYETLRRDPIVVLDGSPDHRSVRVPVVCIVSRRPRGSQSFLQRPDSGWVGFVAESGSYGSKGGRSVLDTDADETFVRLFVTLRLSVDTSPRSGSGVRACARSVPGSTPLSDTGQGSHLRLT